MSDFEREIEEELHRVLDPVTAGPAPARTAPHAGGMMKRKILGGAGAALAAKLAVGFAVAVFAMAGATAATEISSTGSLNPADWGQQVKIQVDACQDRLRASGVRGIGDCVSDFAQQHGKLVSGSHASGARDNGHGNANGQSKDKDNGHSKDHK